MDDKARYEYLHSAALFRGASADGEGEGMTEYCNDCVQILNSDGYSILLCSKHAAADKTLAMLKIAREAIASLEEDALGMGIADGRYTWPIRNELLANIDNAIAAAERVE